MALGASHDMESSQYKYKKKGFLTKKVEKGVDQSTTSHPVEIKSADKTIIETPHGNIDS